MSNSSLKIKYVHSYIHAQDDKLRNGDLTNAGLLCTFWPLRESTIHWQSDNVCKDQLILQARKHTLMQ